MKKRTKPKDAQVFNTALGSTLKSIRTNHNISQLEVATAVGRQRTYISELESGVRDNPTINTLRLICQHYDVLLSDVISQSEKAALEKIAEEN